jgi:hypothetical protein
MSNYDTPHSTLESHRGKTTSMEFAVGTQFESATTAPLNTPSYNNPLASVPTVENLATFYDGSGATGTQTILTKIRNCDMTLKNRKTWLYKTGCDNISIGYNNIRTQL